MSDINFLILMADQHRQDFLGCYGNSIVKTPNLDKLANQGTLFANASTNSPICVAARACLATGKYVHQNKCWDNAIAYDGSIPSWGHHLQQANISVNSIGKLHYRFDEDPTGFDEQFIPMHIANGTGDLMGSIRPELPERKQSRKYSELVGPGETEYTNYDRDISAKACAWLQERSISSQRDKPFVLFVSFIAPHFPLIVPEEYYNLYKDLPIPTIKKSNPELDDHPWWKAFNECYTFDRYFQNDDHRKKAIISYLGLCTFVDALIGNVLCSLDKNGFSKNTNIMYLSDHGENLGARRLWGKSVMYEESVAVPIILSEPIKPKGKIVKTPVSLIDVFPTILDAFDLNKVADTPGRSLFEIANENNNSERLVFSEYHGAGAVSGAFMIRDGVYKYIHYVGYDSELYNLEDDPNELINLSKHSKYQEILAYYQNHLFSMLDPKSINSKALADQADLIKRNGGIEKVLERGGLNGTPVPEGQSTQVDLK
ncbi:MAG: sulfatase-like hydrolase/transferase [SAR202 cluster bacterium]|jgi:choline-sulfatase|nr:sulfatase-like hydrolase/transferase [SAR202 cluster bacterium]